MPHVLAERAVVAVKTLASHALKGDEFNFWCACGVYHNTVEEWADHALSITLLEAGK